jgi:hypothetical protein
MMQTGYSGTQGNCPRYLCGRAKQLYGGDKGCQSLGGRRLENRVLQEVFAVLEPAALAGPRKLSMTPNRPTPQHCAPSS